ncbi:TPA: Glucose-1-phosphate adenylyltransferase [Trebouxia sp. C0004]
MVLTCGSMPAKASMPHVRHRNMGYAKSVAGSGKLGFSQAISDVSLCNKKVKTVHRKAQLVQAVIEKPLMENSTARSVSSSIAAVILGGGAGSRLYPLTKQRAKPAVPIGGAYRLIDVPMSNCINSGISKIYILTQFNSTSLNRHLARTYNFGSGVRFGGDGFVEVLAATQTPTDKEWFQGTADAVRQYAWLFEDIKNRVVQDIVILSGDHLYRMDYMKFVEYHRDQGADITVGCLPVDYERASDFGLMNIDSEGVVTKFAEKPKGKELDAMKVDTTVLGLDEEQASKQPFIASMGIYVFKKDVLVQLLKNKYPGSNDFGGEIIPMAAAEGQKVIAYLFNDYWEDIGTMKSFFDANLALAQTPPKFEFYDPQSPIYTSPRFLPPAKIVHSKIADAIVSHGAFLEECSVENAIIGLRSRIGKNAIIRDAMIMGADYYESDQQRETLLDQGRLPIGVGDNTEVSNTIVDKNARIGKNCKIMNKEGIEESNQESKGYYIRSGIVTILRNAEIKDGTVI